ncbi:unnamed protein product [Schistosoma bovis]|nr:unnamed protein product [Schistosoma bovis]
MAVIISHRSDISNINIALIYVPTPLKDDLFGRNRRLEFQFCTTNFSNNLSYVNKTFTLDNNHFVCFDLANNRSNRIRYSIETMENILSQCEDATFAGAYAKRGPEPLWVVETK